MVGGKQLHLGEGEGEREEEVAPREDDAEQRRHHHAGRAVGQDDPVERLDRVAAVDQRRLVELDGHGVEEIHHHPDHNGQQHRDVDQDQPEVGVQQAGEAQQQEVGDREHRRRHDALGDEEEGDVVVAQGARAEGEAREPVGRERAEEERDRGRDQAHDKAREIGPLHADAARAGVAEERGPAVHRGLVFEEGDVGRAADHAGVALERGRQRPEEGRHHEDRPGDQRRVLEHPVEVGLEPGHGDAAHPLPHCLLRAHTRTGPWRPIIRRLKLRAKMVSAMIMIAR